MDPVNPKAVETDKPVMYSKASDGKVVWSVDPAVNSKAAVAKDKMKDLKRATKPGEKDVEDDQPIREEEPVKKAFTPTKTLHHTPAGPGKGGVVQRPGPMALHQAIGDLAHHAPAGMGTRGSRDQTLGNHIYGLAQQAGQAGLKGKSGATYRVQKSRSKDEQPAQSEPQVNWEKYSRHNPRG